MPDVLHFTGDREANELIASEPLALLIGFVLDQQVPVPTAFIGPLKLKQRLGRLDAGELAGLDPDRLDAIFREKPAIHRFPGSMAKRVQELAAVVAEEYDGDASLVWRDASGPDDLKRRLAELPGFGEMKVKALASVLARRLGVAAAEPLVPSHPMLGDVDSPEALAEYQAAKRAYKASLRAED
ncbi:MAG: DNA repair protein [Actinobacteria bacterium]|nr:DNA repair protein [Actinomycetota bacterium]